ncbi:MAG: prepilin-type N-terminal cleavage/methylation domain-containing protein [Deltaproteobacteria bacterium]|nr:prepilin-type N-terminal cleavage/methylation domain-containing protein [Deltaproteobacteria bacterium]
MSGRTRDSGHSKAAGFTLVEAAITVAVLALAVGVVLVNWGSAGAELRRVAGQLAGTVRASYDGAALSGQTYRLVLSFDKPVIQVEKTAALLSFDDDQKPLQRGAALAGAANGVGPSLSGLLLGAGAKPEADDRDHDDEPADDGPPSALQALMGLSKQIDHEAAATFSSAEHDLPLGEEVRLLDVWIRGMGDPIKEGTAYLYFFPSGYTQDAVIHLTNADGAVFSVRVHALTGSTAVVPEYLEPPK